MSRQARIRRAAIQSISRVVPLKNILIPMSVPITHTALEGPVLQIMMATTRVTIPSTQQPAAAWHGSKSRSEHEFEHTLDASRDPLGEWLACFPQQLEQLLARRVAIARL
jgi:hypothetical protein